MCKVHAARLLALTVAVALGGCVASTKAEAPAGVTLEGNWRLDHAASTDPSQVIAKMRNQAQRILQRQGMIPDTPTPRGGQGGAGGAGTAQGPEVNPALGGDDSQGARGARRPDPLQYSPMMHVLNRVVARGDYLSVHQSSAELVLDFGSTQRSYTPGAHSVVSSETGVADQTSGWDGREYRINIRAQLGPNVVETYGLSSDGTRLIDKLRVGPAELPAFELTRVYARATEGTPRPPATSD